MTEDQSDELIGVISVTNLDEGMDVHNKKDNEDLNIHEDINSIEKRLALSVSVGEDHIPNKICEFRVISSGNVKENGGDDSKFIPFTVDSDGECLIILWNSGHDKISFFSQMFLSQNKKNESN